MPELPEVETMVRGVRERFEGRRVADLVSPACDCRPLTIRPGWDALHAATVGQSVRKVFRRAKRIVLQFETGFATVIEPRMTGLLLLADPPDQNHLRLEWVLQRGRSRQSVWYWDRRGLGTVSLLSPAELDALLHGPKLGPDALEMTLPQWRTALGRTQRAIKVALLDQVLVAGIGNLYASEILHRAKIHPGTAANELSLARIKRIHAATLAILQDAIRYEGSTLGDGTYRNALNKSGGYQNKHVVYGKAGEQCTTCCKATIIREVQAQRSTFYCGRCQK